MRCGTLGLWIAVGLATTLATATGPAAAGPWPRGTGEVFLSFGLEARDSRVSLMTTGSLTPETHLSLYGEYGLSPRLTFGLDLNRGERSDFAQAFLRYTLTRPEAGWQVAVDLGAAQQGADGMADRRYARLGLSLGRGLQPGGGRHWAMPLAHDGGWATLDAVGLMDIADTERLVWQVEGTVGLRLQNGWRAALAIKAEEWSGADFLLTAAPSVMIDLGPRNTVQIGARVGLDGSDDIGLRLNLWHEF
jgi:hypothetical protein